jgi:KaiC/GvpD/RAD55 family RecA-like ATPase
MARGQGARCIGFQSGEGWCHCSRIGEGTRAKYHEESQTWSHRARGKCPCGETHAPGDPNDEKPWEPHRPIQEKPSTVRQIGEAKRAKVVATYRYLDLNGDLLYEVLRTEPKSFKQRRPDGKGGWIWSMKGRPTTLYQIPELIPGLMAGDPILVVEGEADVDALRAVGCVATCNTGGAGKWRDELSAAFLKSDRCEIRVVQDRDEPGEKHARQVFDSISAILPEGSSIRIVEAAEGKDAADHLAAGRTVEEFVQIWPEPEDLLESDPQRFKRAQLRKALERPEKTLSFVSDDPELRANQIDDRQPLFKTGLAKAPFYTHWRGCVAISGEPSTGKSYIAISTAIDAALAGWDVFYLSAEMHQDLIRDRAALAVASANVPDDLWRDQRTRTDVITAAKRIRLPDTWNHLDVGIGVTIEDVVGMLAETITARPTLVVFDSLSSFVDAMDDGKGGDTFGMSALRHVTKWVVGTRKLSHGHIAFLLLSELNKEGVSKGRFLDHRCDTALSMTKDPDNESIKKIRIIKNWWGRTGDLGDFLLDHEMGRLVRIYDGTPKQTTAKPATESGEW